MSPTSSRNKVPWCASSNRPVLRAMAPVNAPFSWPNNSLSSSPSGIAAQFTFTKVLHRLDERFDLYGQRRIPSVDLAYAAPRSDVPDRQEPEAEGETARCVSRRSRRPDRSEERRVKSVYLGAL